MEQVKPVVDWRGIFKYLKPVNLSKDEKNRLQQMLTKVPQVMSGKRRRTTVMTQKTRFNLIVVALFHRWNNASIQKLSLSLGLSERTARRFMKNTHVVGNHFYFPLRDIEKQTKRVPEKVECVQVLDQSNHVGVVWGKLISVGPPRQPSFCTKRARQTTGDRVVCEIPLRVGPPRQTNEALSAADTLLSLCM